MAALFTTVSLLFLFCTTGALAADTIKIGEINTYSKLTNFTFPYRNGWQLALDEINAAGGVNGKMLEVISRDDAGKPGTAVTIAEELVTKDQVTLLMGSFFSHVGLAVTDFAKRNKVLYVAAEPLSDALVWAKGNRYTFRLRPSTYMQAAMLAAEAAKNPAKRWATIAPNYAYGKDAVKSFKKILKNIRPDVEFVAEQWPALFKINAGSEIQALAAAKPEAVYNVTFGGDLAKFVREGKLRGFFKNTFVVSLLTGEPEYIDPLKGEAPEGWLVTGYPWNDIKTPAHDKFLASYQKKFNDYPRTGSLVGYNVMMAVAAMLKKAGTTDTEKMVDAMEGLTYNSPVGPVHFRKIDHQSTMGAYVGYTALQDGKGKMVDWKYKDGKDFLPSDDEVKQLRVE
ncbi:MAG: ABC transporter substrate-binding protein [Thermodesulfobacteriota bacterium]|nr:ABC transporter substrate-binding protein [Thermodesulfobacteriota bacterium]